MKFENIRVNAILKNKVNQKTYLVTGDNEGRSYDIVEQLTEEQQKEQVSPEILSVNAKNAVCFCLVDDPNFEQFTLEGGKFQVNNKPVILGTVKPVKLLCTGKSKAILLCETGTANRYSIMEYDAIEDRFMVRLENVTSVSVFNEGSIAENLEQVQLMSYETVVDAELVKKDDEIEKLQNFISAGLLAFWPKTNNVAIYPTDYPVGDIRDFIEYDKSVVLATNKNIVYCDLREGEKLKSDTSVDDYEGFDEDDEYGYSKVVDLEGQTRITVIYLNESRRTETRIMNGTYDVVLRAGRNMVYKTSKEIQVSDGNRIADETVVAALTGYNHLVDDSFKDAVTNYSFCNDNYDVITVLAKDYADRGTIYTVIQ